MKPRSERDGSILAQHAAGASFKEIAAAMGVSSGTVRRIVEHVGPMQAKGRAMLTADPENLEGLRLTGGVSHRVYNAIAEATYKVNVPDMERLSDIAAQGRECVARFPKIGPGVMAELDMVMARFGIAWNPRPRPFAYRTDKNRHPLMKLWDEQREQSKREDQRDQHWNSILRRVAEMERTLGTSVLKDSAGRDSAEGVVYRLAFLNGYLESQLEREGKTIDVTPDPEQDDGEYETAGNLVCLPGVKLASVLCNDGSDPGPTAA
jgi:hypothetical protein